MLTIGHSNHDLGHFIKMLKKWEVTAIADVRSTPSSGYCPWFNQGPFRVALKASGIAYVYLGDVLGGRPQDPSCYHQGKLDYALIAQTPAFRRGITRLVAGEEAGMNVIALMCVEYDPLDCHRGILLAPALIAQGVVVKHILRTGWLESHSEMEARLLQKTGMLIPEEAYALRGKQLSLKAK